MCLRWFRERVSRVVSTTVFAVRHAIDGEPPARERHEYDVDCPDHGKTFLRFGLTKCCGSKHWIPSGKVKSRLYRYGPFVKGQPL